MSEISREEGPSGGGVEEKGLQNRPYSYESPSDEKMPDYKTTAVGNDGFLDTEAGEITADTTLETSLQLVTKTLDASDIPTDTPYTFRSFFLGLGLSCFGSVIAEIFYFKPQTITVNIIFLAIISYILGEACTIIPRWGPIGRFLNPGRFNSKEHCFITIMAISASVCALGTEQLAVQSLYYNETPNGASAVFMLFSSQMMGYGMIGGMRKLFVYPTKMLWPTKLPLASLFQSFHIDNDIAKKRLLVFYWVTGAVFIWELIPEYIFPLTTGVSIFCLANQHSEAFTYLFGGANGDEGLGFLSWCFDWQYVGTDMLILPLTTQFNQFIGYIICIALTTGIYWGNLWKAKNFPFMSQILFLENGSEYNQTKVLGSDNVVDPALRDAYGLPWFATSNAMSLLVMNIGITAAIVHVICWNWDDIKVLFVWAKPDALREWWTEFKAEQRWKFWTKSTYVEKFPGTEGDPHFEAMQVYKEAPNWWYHVMLVLALVIGLICTYQQKTGLPWWAFLISCLLAFVMLMFYAPFYAITGFYYQPVSAVQMIGGYMVPGKPVANMMFTLYGSNSMVQGLLMLSDLKLAQYAKLPPQATFLAQILGTLTGSVLNWVMMNSIVTNQRETLLSVEGSNIWSGQNVQSYNAQAVAWGGVGNEIFSSKGPYFMVPIGLVIGIFAPLPFWLLHKKFPRLRLNLLNTSLIATWSGWLSVGINSSLMPYFFLGLFSQGYLRRYKPTLFAKYNWTVTAAIGGGFTIIVFILTFAVFGGSGKEHNFPVWWGNNLEGNVDRCLYVET